MWLKGLLVISIVAAAGVPPAQAVDLDPFPTRASKVAVLGASSAGVLYAVSPVDGVTPPVHWVKPAAGPAYQVPANLNQLAGSWIFDLSGPTDEVSYQQIGTPITRTCDQIHTRGLATPFGWVAGGKRVDVSTSGCVVTAQLARENIVAADGTGYLDVRFVGGDGTQLMTYYKYGEPTHSHQLYYSKDAAGFALSGSAITWRTNGAIYRGNIDGSPERLLATLGGGNQQTSIVGGSTGWVGCDNFGNNCVAGSIDADGTQHQLPGTRSLVSDGSRFVFDTHTATSYAVDAAAAVDATSPRTRIVDVAYLPPLASVVAVGADGVAYVDSQAPAPSISQRGYSRSGTTIAVSGQTRVATGSLVARDGRRTAYVDTAGELSIFRDDGVRTKVFTSVERVAVVIEQAPIRLSGTRLLWWKGLYTGEGCDQATCFPTYNKYVPMLYNVATGTNSQLTGPVDLRPATIWGSYLAYADAAQAIWRRDLSSNALVQVKPPGGSPITDIAANDDYVAWSICQPDCNPSMVTYRNMATRAAAVQIVTYGTRQISMSGGHVLFNTTQTPAEPQDVLEVLRLGTKATGMVGPYRAGTRFSVHDETLGWVGVDGMAKLSPNSPFVAPPRFLGNTIGTASFAPADGPWTPEFPISKALTSCTLTIKSGTTVRRVLTCPTTVGSARPSWNGLDSAGHLVAKGTYSWTLTASDSDGTLRWWTNATHPIAGTVRVT